MKFALALTALMMMTAPAFANDGGVAAIKVSQIKMREFKNGEEVRRLAKPDFKITFSGGEAKNLQKILPSTFSVLTAMQPELKKSYDETFKQLGIYSGTSEGVTAKTLSIECNDGDLKSTGEGKFKIVKKSATTCTISINAAANEQEASEPFGDAATFVPKCSN